MTPTPPAKSVLTEYFTEPLLTIEDLIKVVGGTRYRRHTSRKDYQVSELATSLHRSLVANNKHLTS